MKTKTPNPLTQCFCWFFALWMALPASVLADLTVNVPTFPSSNTVRISLSGAQTNKLYQIEYTIALGSNGIPFSAIATGIVGQTVFDFTKGTNDVNFFRAYETNAPDSLLVATPVLNPAGGSYPVPTNVTITCATPLAAIFYTTNGNTPTPSDNYIPSGQSVFLNCSVTLKAKVFRSGYTDSGVASATYSINCTPFVYAGAQQIISTDTTTLEGVVTDDGLTGGGTKSTNWSKISGPGSVTFVNANQTNTSVTLGSQGIYTLQLVANDGQYASTSKVVIAWNPNISISIVEPTNGSTYTVPTNFVIRASASGSVTQIVFFAGNTAIGTATSPTVSGYYQYEWKNVLAGSYALTAVVLNSDTNNSGLASAPVNITVNWPTNVGQLQLSSTDVRIPVAGNPIAVNRNYDSRSGVLGSFGYNWKLDYEDIQVSATVLSNGWSGTFSGGQYCIKETAFHLVTVSLSDSEKYYFTPKLVFTRNGNTCVNVVNPDCNSGEHVRFEFTAVPGGLGSLSMTNQPVNMSMRTEIAGGWVQPLMVRSNNCSTMYDPPLNNYVFTSPTGIRHEFNPNGKLAKKTDLNGNGLAFSDDGITYSNAAVASSVKRVKFTKSSGLITAIHDPLSLDSSGNVIGPAALTYVYDASSNLTNVNRLIDRATTNYEATAYRYTNSAYPHHITGVADKTGFLTARYEYDASGRVVRNYDALSNVMSYAYDLTNRRYYLTNRLGYVSIQIFNDAGQLASSVNNLGAVVSFGYDSFGRTISETNELGQATRFAYDAADNLVGVTNRLGYTNQFFYGTYQRETIWLDALGAGTTNLYDSKGNLIAITNAAGGVKRFAYDAQGNVVSETNELSQTTRYAYDAFGNLTAITNAASAVTLFSYDANGNRTNRVDALSRTTSYEYDAANRLVRTLYSDNSTEAVAYDQPDKILRQTNQAGVVTAFAYDAVGQRTAVTNALGTTNQTVTLYGYDAEGNLTRQTDGLGRATRLAYDPVNRVVRRTLPLGPDSPAPPSYYESFSHDAAGNVVSYSDFNGRTTQFTFDAEGHLLSKTNGGVRIATYAFDANGQRTNMVDASGTSRYQYDPLRQLTNKVTPQGTLSYTYDAAGRLLTAVSSTPNGTKTTNVWSVAGQLTNVIDRFGNTTRYEYDGSGLLTRTILPNNVTNTYDYDPASQLTNIVARRSSGTIASYSYKLDAVGSITNVTELNGRNVRYGYDIRGRLRTESVTSDPGSVNGTVNYALDAIGNRLRRESALAGITSTTNTFDDNDRISGEAFDQAGNTLTNSSSIALQYDSENQLTNFNAAQVVIIYDGDGNRVKKTVGGVTTLYLVDDLNDTGYAQVLEELSATNATPLRLYTYGVGLISQRTSGGATHYFGSDGQRNIRYLTDASGNISDTYTYDAFGNQLASTGTTTNAYRFAGEQLDSDLGLYFLRARYLNYKTGRFITRDRFPGRVSQPHTQHPYVYAAADPVNNADPSGLQDINTQVTTTGVQGQLGGQTYTAVARAFKYTKEAACKLQTGVYVIEAWGGKKYVGRTLQTLLRRLRQHERAGRVDLDTLSSFLWFEGPPNATALGLERIEQLIIDAYRDAGETLANQRNPLGGRSSQRFRLCK